MSEERYKRKLFCPICGERVEVPTDGKIPASMQIPRHNPGAFGNLCGGVNVVVRLEVCKCRACGCDMGGHPTGLCLSCFSVEAKR